MFQFIPYITEFTVEVKPKATIIIINSVRIPKSDREPMKNI